jgi:hypothetical protein
MSVGKRPLEIKWKKIVRTGLVAVLLKNLAAAHNGQLYEEY